MFAPTAAGPLMQVSANGGQPEPATTLDASHGETAHRFPAFLPDGKRFLFKAPPPDAEYDPLEGLLRYEVVLNWTQELRHPAAN